jgi:hypothetical protein
VLSEDHKTECATPKLRICGSVLQQWWRVETWRGTTCTGAYGEWRPVPQVDAEAVG